MVDTAKRTNYAARFVPTWLLLVLFTAYTIVTPVGERWFDADGSVCVVAEIGQCIPPDNDRVSLTDPAFHSDHDDFVRDEGCTDCRFVSFSALRGRQDTPIHPLIADSTVAVLVSVTYPPTPELMRCTGFCANAPPPIPSLRKLKATSSPRAPPVS
ncbi:MAG: hypothetical protein H8F28_18775 [Fibrella sp.]|nr:hypothetical protein [Armatimonadota bacterium]